ncbi:MAG TPA: cobalt ECF transporter T component CbiQ [Planctomycetota bacterium]|nr:cobalt ECF transporter T component CbiQ [Planctomycetota bacterium]
MPRIDAALREIGALDALAAQDTPVHRLDPRVKLLATAGFVLAVASSPLREFAELAPLALFPVAMLAAGRVPFRLVGRSLLLASPFAVMVGVFNPLFDREVVAHWGPLAVTGGWLSFLSILARFALTAGAALTLLATTGYVGVGSGLGRLGAPRALVTQFLLLYRYIFVLADEGARAVRAHALRSASGRPATVRVWGSLAGHLLLRAHDRGLRVHAAMLSRGFDGSMPALRPLRWGRADSVFLAACLAFFALARFGHLAENLGRLAVGGAP